MKKVSFLFAMIFAVSMAMGQNSSTVDQSGDGNGATVNQTGENESIIDQDTWGEGHSATVTQIKDLAGSKNTSDVLQDQRGATVDVYQKGATNVSGIKQSGPNMADIDQVGVGNVLGSYTNFGGRAYQKNGTSFANDDNKLWLTQTGDLNKAGVWQEHHATADIDQVGNENKAVVYQTGVSGGSYNEASVNVTGNLNEVDVWQTGEGNIGNVTVDYYGDAKTTAEFNDVVIDQDGDGNQGYLTVKGASNTVDLIQDGNGNREYVQIFGSSNDVDITAAGNNNRGQWLLNGNATSNDLDVVMTGSGNRASGKIRGDGNIVDILQTGDDNWVGKTDYALKNGVDITGDWNSVDIDQLSNGNMSVNTVVGSSNSIVVTQN